MIQFPYSSTCQAHFCKSAKPLGTRPLRSCINPTSLELLTEVHGSYSWKEAASGAGGGEYVLFLHLCVAYDLNSFYRGYWRHPVWTTVHTRLYSSVTQFLNTEQTAFQRILRRNCLHLGLYCDNDIAVNSESKLKKYLTLLKKALRTRH